MYQFEVCANSVASCLAAREGGAQRVELCASIPEGGTTPSYGEIVLARELLDIKLHVIIRPRGGDFSYSALEIDTMRRDIDMCRQIGVDGVVLGALQADGNIDMQAMQNLMKEAEGMSVTFHRAFDMCLDPDRALEQIISLGCSRILTSGQCATAEDGIRMLAHLNQRAAGRIILLAGSGVNELNIATIASETGVREFHFSAREAFASSMTYRNTKVVMGARADVDEFALEMTSAQRVKNIISSLTPRY